MLFESRHKLDPRDVKELLQGSETRSTRQEMARVPVKYLQIQYCEKTVLALKYYDAGKKGKVFIK